MLFVQKGNNIIKPRANRTTPHLATDWYGGNKKEINGTLLKTAHNNITIQLSVIKGTLSRDFRPSVFFINQYPWAP
jgi:hypothetical protein